MKRPSTERDSSQQTSLLCTIMLVIMWPDLRAFNHLRSAVCLWSINTVCTVYALYTVRLKRQRHIKY